MDHTRVQAWPWSGPWVGAMSEVVALERNLIFDLVDQYLRQEDAHQLQKRGRGHQMVRGNVCVIAHDVLLPVV